AVTVVVTNLENGKSVRVHSNAPTFYSAGGGNSGYFRGQGTAFFNSARGEIPQGAWLTGGNWFLTFDIETGRVITASGGILRRDICAELALRTGIDDSAALVRVRWWATPPAGWLTFCWHGSGPHPFDSDAGAAWASRGGC